MNPKGRLAWNLLYNIMQGHELTPETHLIKIEIINLLKHAIPDGDDMEIALCLLVIADSNMHELVARNG